MTRDEARKAELIAELLVQVVQSSGLNDGGQMAALMLTVAMNLRAIGITEEKLPTAMKLINEQIPRHFMNEGRMESKK